MLTKESSHGFGAHFSYPVYEYKSRSGRRTRGNCDGSRMVPTPKGYSEIIRYHDAEEDFASYLKWVEEDHKDLSNAKLLEHPYGCFIGRGRNARWMDEITRRGLS